MSIYFGPSPSGRAATRQSLHLVQLDGTDSKGRKASRSDLVYVVKRVAQLVAVFAVLAIWAAASMATQEAEGNAQKRTSWMEVA